MTRERSLINKKEKKKDCCIAFPLFHFKKLQFCVSFQTEVFQHFCPLSDKSTEAYFPWERHHIPHNIAVLLLCPNRRHPHQHIPTIPASFPSLAALAELSAPSAPLGHQKSLAGGCWSFLCPSDPAAYTGAQCLCHEGHTPTPAGASLLTPPQVSQHLKHLSIFDGSTILSSQG